MVGIHLNLKRKWYKTKSGMIFFIWMENEVSIAMLICNISFFVLTCLLMCSLSSCVIPFMIAINLDKRTWDAQCTIHPQ